jgi:hypothetical protein
MGEVKSISFFQRAREQLVALGKLGARFLNIGGIRRGELCGSGFIEHPQQVSIGGLHSLGG